jgi:hypothetical protein
MADAQRTSRIPHTASKLQARVLADVPGLPMMDSTTKDRENAMKTRHLASKLASLGLILGWLAGVSASWASDNFTAVTAADKPVKKTKQAKQTQGPKPPTDKGSAENKSEREKRLIRECRGRPNAGACEGYAS